MKTIFADEFLSLDFEHIIGSMKLYNGFKDDICDKSYLNDNYCFFLNGVYHGYVKEENDENFYYWNIKELR